VKPGESRRKKAVSSIHGEPLAFTTSKVPLLVVGGFHQCCPLGFELVFQSTPFYNAIRGKGSSSKRDNVADITRGDWKTKVLKEKRRCFHGGAFSAN